MTPTKIGKLGKFRCVYCKKRLRELAHIAGHEMQCPLRVTVQQQWAYQREEALATETIHRP